MTVVETLAFSTWLAALKDARGRAKIVARVERVRLAGHFGDKRSPRSTDTWPTPGLLTFRTI